MCVVSLCVLCTGCVVSVCVVSVCVVSVGVVSGGVMSVGVLSVYRESILSSQSHLDSQQSDSDYKPEGKLLTEQSKDKLNSIKARCILQQQQPTNKQTNTPTN